MKRKGGGRRGVMFFGGFDPDYPRNLIIRKGLERIGVQLSECRADGKKKVTTRYPVLAGRFMRSSGRKEIIYVPDFRHKDVPLAWLLARISGARVVFDPLVSRYETRILDRKDAKPGSLQAWHNRNIDRISMRLADLVLADTKAHADFYADEFKIERSRLKTLYIGYDDDYFIPAPGSSDDGLFRVLFYGSYLPLHGAETIVKTAMLLVGEGFSFTLVGGGQTYGEARRLAHEPVEGEEIEFRDFVPIDQLPSLIARADVVLGIFGTTEKSAMVIPNKIYQAMACERPVITADTPAIRELFSSGEDIVLVPGGDSEALAAALRNLRDDRHKRDSIASKGSILVRERFNPEKVAGSLIGILNDAGFPHIGHEKRPQE